ncbi:MAG TPA: glycosyltransferase [Actinomycetota bacterium]|nr:glycosyltransferase [Actinomycetota bacterium]
MSPSRPNKLTVAANAANESLADRLLAGTVTRLKRAARVVLPGGTRRRQLAMSLIDRSEGAANAAFQRWIASVEPGLWSPLAPPGGPLISVVVPAYNTPDRYLVPLIDSVLAQTYPRWGLCLVDGSTDPARSEAIAAQALRDDRIQLIRLDSNRGIAGNTNAGIEAARGDFVAFLDHDDTLAPGALNEVAAGLAANPGIELFFSDEDKLSDDGDVRSHPFFKPGWCRDLFLYGNYLAHFVVARTELVHKIGRVRPGFEGAQDYDFILRALDHDPVIAHVPRFSYHWRFAEGSTSTGARRKKGAGDAGYRALSEYLTRNGIAAEVERIPDYPTNYRVRYQPSTPPAVHLAAGPGRFLGELQSAADYPALDILDDLHAVGQLPPEDVIVVVEVSGRPLHPTWIAELAGVAVQPGVGCVTPAVLDAWGTSAGIGWGAAGDRLWPLLAGDRWSRFTRASQVAWPRNLVAAGSIVALTVGLAAELARAGAALDCAGLSLGAHQRGLRNVYWPFARFLSPERLEPIARPDGIVDRYVNPNLAPDQRGLPDPPQS